MKRTIAIIPVIAILLSACGAKEEVTDSVEAKMAQIAEYKSEIKDLEIKIRDLEKEIIANGGSLELPPDTVAVTTMTIERGTYEEFVEVAGSVSSDQNILVSSEMGGTVTRIYVKEGQQVSAGQLLLSTDDQVLQKSIDELQNAYDLAKTVYEKRKALWDQKIGSEIEYLTAKNNMESLELKLNTTRTQLAKTQLKSPISGTVDEIITKTGEMASPGMPLLRVVNLSEVQIECDISEAYLGRVKRGDKVNVSFLHQLRISGYYHQRRSGHQPIQQNLQTAGEPEQPRWHAETKPAGLSADPRICRAGSGDHSYPSDTEWCEQRFRLCCNQWLCSEDRYHPWPFTQRIHADQIRSQWR